MGKVAGTLFEMVKVTDFQSGAGALEKHFETDESYGNFTKGHFFGNILNFV